MGLRLGSNVCVPRACVFGIQVDACDTHAFVCKRAPGRIARHQALNDVARAIASAGDPVTKEPVGLARQNGKRPDGLTLFVAALKALDLECHSGAHASGLYVSVTARSRGAAAEQAAGRKTAKYDLLVQTDR